MEHSLQKFVDEQEIAKENAKLLIEAYGAPFTEAGEILENYQYDDEGELIVTDKTIVVTDESDEKAMKKARELRLALKKVRTTVENKRVKLKEDSLKTGRAIDGVAKYIKENIQPVEEYLEKQEKFAELRAAERKFKLKAERIEKIRPLVDNPFSYEYIGDLDEAEFDKFYNELVEAHNLQVAQKEAYDREQAKIAADKEAEDARVREENEILKKQAEEREEAAAKEREEMANVHEAEKVHVAKTATQTVLGDVKTMINTLDRFTVADINDGNQMIDYKAVLNLIDVADKANHAKGAE